MKEWGKKLVWIGGVAIVLFAVVAYFNLLDVSMRRIFGVAREDARREIFEETKSYVHGKIQDLAKYYEEYQKNPEDREIIAQVIRIRFAEFDADKIKNRRLREFLITIRGY